MDRNAVTLNMYAHRVEYGTNSTYAHSHNMPKINSSSVKNCEVLARFLPSSCPLLAQNFSIVTRTVVIKFAGAPSA